MASESNSSTSLPKVVIARDLGPDVMPLLLDRKDIQVVVWPENRKCDQKWLSENIKGAAGVLVMMTEPIDAEFLDTAGPNLRVVSTMSVGYEHANLQELSKRKVRFGYTPDVLTEAVADVSVMLALMAGRITGELTDLVKSGGWPGYTWSPFAFCGQQISATATNPTRTIGFLGFGRIAQATLARLIPFGVTDCIYTGNPNSSTDHSDRDAALRSKHGLRSLQRVGLDELARESDVLFVLAPGGSATKHVINESILKQMKRTSVLVNTARGTLVDSDALAKALGEGWIWGAGLDVVEGEPNVTKDHPLQKHPRCVILPHIGSATFETRLGMATLAVNNLLGGVFGDAMPAELNTSR